MPYIIRPTVTQIYQERVKATPDQVCFQFKPSHADFGTLGTWRHVTMRDFDRLCRQVSFGLMGLGVKPGDKVVLLSSTRFEWPLCDMAILGAGAITVPIYPSHTASDAIHILEQCDAKFAFLENSQQLEKLLPKRDSLKKLEKLILLEPSAMRLAAGRPDALSLPALMELGKREEARDPSRFDSHMAAALPQDLLTICYTSGTTGAPKGVMLTHDNMVSVLEDAVEAFQKYTRPESEVLLAFLPFSHVLGKVESIATYTFGWRECYAENLDQLMDNMAEIKPTLVFAVPRIFEKAVGRIKSMVETGPASQRKLFNWAYEIGRQYYCALAAGDQPSLAAQAQMVAARKLVLNKIAGRFGGRLKFAICGGAPLSQEVGEYCQIVGIPVLEGYGLTETCAPVTLNLPKQLRFGTVGRPLKEVALRLADDGEILVNSRKVFSGYYKFPEESTQAKAGSWLRTGDIGVIDDQGYLRITDRKKDLIVTSGGKNVAPQKLEKLARAQPFISELIVYGDGRPYLTALITLDRAQIQQFASEQQILFSDFDGLIHHPKIRLLVQKLVDDINRDLSGFETIKKFTILAEDLSIQEGELTPSHKVKRNVVYQKYRRQLDEMYDT